MSDNRMRIAGTMLVGASLFLFSGCGYKNQPVPPESVVPKAVTDLRYVIGDEGVTLSWSYPVETLKGTEIEAIAVFDLYQAEVPLNEYCSTCPIPFADAVEIEGGVPIDGTVRRQAKFTTTLLQPGYKYFYKVRSRTSWWADSFDSNIISFTWFEPAQAPAGLSAKAGDGQVKLSWQPVMVKGQGEIRYQVLRSQGGKDMENLGEPLTDTSFVDRQVVNGQKYFYAVQAVTVYEQETALGRRTEAAAVVPVDLTPPPPIGGVTAVRTDVGIKVFWDRSEAADLAGYRVYRRSSQSGNWELMGQVGKEFTLFVDSQADGSVRYFYAVTAVDQMTPPNESEISMEATIR